MKLKQVTLGLLAMGLATSPALAQHIAQRNLPAVVLNTFQQQFSKARNVEWEKKASGLFEAEFEMGLMQRDHTVYISPDGKLERHIEEISTASLPDAVKKQLAAEYGNYRVNDAKKIESGQQVTYRVELENRMEELELTLDTAGKVLQERAD